MSDFKFNLGDEVKDAITGFTGIVISRCQWLNNCNTYGVQPCTLKDGVPQDKHYFDEPQLIFVTANCFSPSQNTGGPERRVQQPNRN